MSHPVVEIWERSYWATLSFRLRRWNLFVGMSAIRQSYRIKNLSEALKVTKKGKGIDLFIFRRPHTWAIDQLGLSLASFQSSGKKNKRAIVVQSDYIGCKTGNGEKLSNSQACCLAQLCLAAALFRSISCVTSYVATLYSWCLPASVCE